MITLSTPTADIISALAREERKAQFWLKKQHHGDRGYTKMQDGLIDEAKRKREDTHSPVVDYISPEGNRWMVFEHCRYYKDVHEAITQPIAFCYYETLGSVGAFLNGHSQYEDPTAPPHAIMFTDHFFLRFCQRLGVEMRSRWMVKRFLEIIPGIMFQTTGETDKCGRYKVDCRFPGSIGRGIIRKDGPLIEVRTFLTDRELNGKQLRETKHLRQTADTHNFDPQIIKMKRALLSDDFASAMEAEMKQAVAMGADERTVSMTMTWGVFIINALCDLGWADPKDIDFWAHHGEANKELIIDIGEHYVGVKTLPQTELGQRFEQILQNDRIKGYDLRKFYAHIDNQIKQLSKRI